MMQEGQKPFNKIVAGDSGNQYQVAEIVRKDGERFVRDFALMNASEPKKPFHIPKEDIPAIMDVLEDAGEHAEVMTIPPDGRADKKQEELSITKKEPQPEPEEETLEEEESEEETVEEEGELEEESEEEDEAEVAEEAGTDDEPGDFDEEEEPVADPTEEEVEGEDEQEPPEEETEESEAEDDEGEPEPEEESEEAETEPGPGNEVDDAIEMIDKSQLLGIDFLVLDILSDDEIGAGTPSDDIMKSIASGGTRGYMSDKDGKSIDKTRLMGSLTKLRDGDFITAVKVGEKMLPVINDSGRSILEAKKLVMASKKKAE